MRREVFDCDTCGEQLHRTERGQATVRIEEFCVVVTVQCRRDRVSVDQLSAQSSEEHTFSETLHVCYGCANNMFQPCSHFGFLLVDPQPVSERYLQRLEPMARYVDVVVQHERAAHDPPRQSTKVISGNTIAQRYAHSLNDDADEGKVIGFPVGTVVRLLADKQHKVAFQRVKVIGYRVREAFAADMASPRCGVCNVATKPGQPVFIPYTGAHAEEAVCMSCSVQLHERSSMKGNQDEPQATTI